MDKKKADNLNIFFGVLLFMSAMTMYTSRVTGPATAMLTYGGFAIGALGLSAMSSLRKRGQNARVSEVIRDVMRNVGLCAVGYVVLKYLDIL